MGDVFVEFHPNLNYFIETETHILIVSHDVGSTHSFHIFLV